MYQEHIIGTLLDLVQGSRYTGGDVDAGLGRVTVEIGAIIGPLLGYRPSDAALNWHARTTGTPVPPGTRGAVHTLPDGRAAVGLGAGRGVLETAGDELVTVTQLDPSRYTGAWRLPTIEYGGLI